MLIRELLFFKLISPWSYLRILLGVQYPELIVAKSGLHPWYHLKEPYKSMAFGDVLHDGLVICSLHRAVEQNAATTQQLFWSNVVRLSVIPPIQVVLSTIGAPAKLKRRRGKLLGVKWEGIHVSNSVSWHQFPWLSLSITHYSQQPMCFRF